MTQKVTGISFDKIHQRGPLILPLVVYSFGSLLPALGLHPIVSFLKLNRACPVSKWKTGEFLVIQIGDPPRFYVLSDYCVCTRESVFIPISKYSRFYFITDWAQPPTQRYKKNGLLLPTPNSSQVRRMERVGGRETVEGCHVGASRSHITSFTEIPMCSLRK